MGASAGAVRAGGAFVELSADGSKLAAGLKQAESKLASWGQSIGALGTKMVTAGAGITGLAIGALQQFASIGSALVDLSDQTGIGIVALQEFGFAAQQSGSNMEQLTQGIGHMQRSLAAAAEGGAEANGALRNLNWNIGDLASLNPEQQFERIATAVAGIENPTARTAAAMGLFGRAGARLIPTFQSLNQERQNARSGTRIISPEEARVAESFGDSLSMLGGEMKKVAFVAGLALVPAATQVITFLKGATAVVIEFIDNNRGLVVGLAVGGAALVIAGAALWGLSAALTLAGTLFGALGVVVSLVNLPMIFWNALVWGAGIAVGVFNVVVGICKIVLLVFKGVMWLVSIAVAVMSGGISLATFAFAAFIVVIAAAGLALAALPFVAVAAAIGYVVAQFSTGMPALSGFMGLLRGLGAVFSQVWGAVQSALGQGDLAGAMMVAWAGLKVAWEMGIGFLRVSWAQWSGWFMGTADAAFTALAVTAVGVWARLRLGWIDFVASFEETWQHPMDFMEASFRRVWGLLTSIFRVQMSNIQALAEIAWTALLQRLIDTTPAGLLGRLGLAALRVGRTEEQVNADRDRRNQAINAVQEVAAPNVIQRDQQRQQIAQQEFDQVARLQLGLQQRRREREGAVGEAQAQADRRVREAQDELDRATEEIEGRARDAEAMRHSQFGAESPAAIAPLAVAMSSVGTFSAAQAAAFGTGGTSPAERTAQSAAELVRIGQQTLQAMRTNVLVWR